MEHDPRKVEAASVASDFFIRFKDWITGFTGRPWRRPNMLEIMQAHPLTSLLARPSHRRSQILVVILPNYPPEKDLPVSLNSLRRKTTPAPGGRSGCREGKTANKPQPGQQQRSRPCALIGVSLRAATLRPRLTAPRSRLPFRQMPQRSRFLIGRCLGPGPALFDRGRCFSGSVVSQRSPNQGTYPSPVA